MKERRKLEHVIEQKIYDGFVDHARDITRDDLFQPRAGDGIGFSPFAYIIDRLFRDTLEQGSVADEATILHPNPQFKRPAYYAALDLRSGDAVRGTTDLIDKWREGGHVGLAGHQLSRNSITRNGSYPKYVAYFYDGVIYYEWGALPGHRFPEDAVALSGKEWDRVVKALSATRKFERGSFLYRKKQFASFEQTVNMELPKASRLYRIWAEHGTLGLLKLFFGSRWEAAIMSPDMSAFRGLSHCYIKNSIDLKFCLCSMDDAIHHKLSINSDCTIHDLTSKVVLKGEQ